MISLLFRRTEPMRRAARVLEAAVWERDKARRQRDLALAALEDLTGQIGVMLAALPGYDTASGLPQYETARTVASDLRAAIDLERIVKP